MKVSKACIGPACPRRTLLQIEEEENVMTRKNYEQM